MEATVKVEPINIDSPGGKKKGASARPSLQIYRPPGLRNVPASSTAPPNEPKKSNPSNSGFSTIKEDPSSSRASSSSSSTGTNAAPITKQQTLNFTSVSDQPQPRPSKPRPPETKTPSLTRTLSSVIKEPRKKPLIQKDIEDIQTALQNLTLVKERALIDEFLASNLESETAGRSLGQYLVQHAIEENKSSGRVVARLCAALLECPSRVAFHQGLVTSILQYYECRDQLRVNHLRVWIGFLTFVSDLYANVGFTYEGEMVEVIFNLFDYLLKPPVLESLKIEELECIIASLLSIGYDLERQCPDELGRLKNQIRDAFVDVSEPWARKMILLLMELTAGSWTLPQDAHEYYFG